MTSSLETRYKEFLDTTKKERAKLASELEFFIEQFMRANDLPIFCMTAYTPYFNDGDVCRYTIYSSYDDTIKYYKDNEIDLCRKLTKEDVEYDSPFNRSHMELENFLYSVKDLVLELYGDHKQICYWIDKDNEFNIEANDYDHD